MAGSAVRDSRYLASDRELWGLTVDERAQRGRLQKSIGAKPVKKGCVRCFLCTDFHGGFHTLESGLRPSKAYLEQRKRWNLAAGTFVTRHSPLDFGFPAKGWLGKLLNNNYGTTVEDAYGQPDSQWVQERGQVCLVLDVLEQWLQSDAKYRGEGRSVFFIPHSTFDESGVVSPDFAVYGFLTTLEEPPRALTALTKKRLGHALTIGDLFDVRWLLELGAPLEDMQHRMLTVLTHPGHIQDDEDLEEACRIQTFLLERSERQEQRLQLHLSGEHFLHVQRAMMSWAEPQEAGGTVDSLDLGCGHIGPQGASLLAEVLENSNFLQELSLPGNSICDQGASALGEALKHNGCLQSLDLMINNIGKQGASALGEALKQNSCLQSLNLGGNNIRDQGASVLAEALKHNGCLQWLELGSNGIGNLGASGLGEGLKENRSLLSLHLLYNKISSQGAAALGEALRCNRSLEFLGLSYNRIDARGVAAMAGCRPMLEIDWRHQLEHESSCAIA